MTLLELNDIIAGRYKESVGANAKRRDLTEEEFEAFRALLNIDDSYGKMLQQTEIASEFYETCPIIETLTDKEIQEDVFYAAKLGYYFVGVPSKLVYILRKAIRQYESPNLAISALDTRVIAKYLKEGALAEGITIKQVIEKLLGTNFELLSDYNRKVQFRTYYEVYIPNTDRVALIPSEIAGYIESYEDLKSLQFDSELGITIHGKPLRTLDGRLGVTVNDYDLRECK